MATSSPAIPFTVIGGYLGAGKTTLLNRLLESTSERLAVLVNDFGEIDIDSSLIDSHDGETISLANGCICCSLADGFFTALQTVRELAPMVDRVVVEASGVADPLQVAQWGHTPGFRLDAVVVLVDADTFVERANDRHVGDTVRRQVQGADLVLLTKTDLVDDVGVVRDRVEEFTDAPILETPFARVPLEVLSGTDDRLRSTGTSNDEPHARHVTASLEFDTPLDDASVQSALRDAPSGLLRAKGVLRLRSTPGQRTVLHVVGRRHSMITASAWTGEERSRIVVIADPTTSVEELRSWLENMRGS